MYLMLDYIFNLINGITWIPSINQKHSFVYILFIFLSNKFHIINVFFYLSWSPYSQNMNTIKNTAVTVTFLTY